jgi:hypothetical protein
LAPDSFRTSERILPTGDVKSTATRPSKAAGPMARILRV